MILLAAPLRAATIETIASLTEPLPAFPQVRLANGVFYGVTYGAFNGGSNHGTIFRLGPNGTLTVAYEFQAATQEEANPTLLINGADGNLYGATAPRAVGDLNGMIFRFTLSGSFTPIFRFQDAKGTHATSLVQAADGNFYGTAAGDSSGGFFNHPPELHNAGIFFKLTPAGEFTTLYTFTGGADGSLPNALRQGADGNFYGSTLNGPESPPNVFSGFGTVFKFTPSGGLTTLYQFMGGLDGGNPGKVVQGNDSNLYGIASYGMFPTVFKVTPGGTRSTVYHFEGDNGSESAGLIASTDGNIYGTTKDGGILHAGSIFSINPASPPGQFTTYLFDGTATGGQPGPLFEGEQHNLYGASSLGGAFNKGTIFRLDIAPVITSPLTATATVDQPFVYQFQTNGATSHAVTGLPPGLTFNTSLRAIIGTPTGAGVSSVGLSASNSSGTVNATLTLTIQPAPSSGPVIRSSTSATGRVGQPFTFHVITTGGGPASRLSATGLPVGLSANAVTGVISGTVTAEGSSAVSLTVTDGNLTATGMLELTFSADPGLPVIVSPDRASLTVDQFFSYTIRAPSNADPSSDPTIFTEIGALPQGLTFDPVTGIISGTYTGLPRNGGAGPDAKDLSGGALLGSIQLFGTNSHGTSTLQLLFLEAPSGAVNIATRLLVGTGENVPIGGFIIQGNAPKVVIIRALGPSTGIPGALQDPTLELHDGAHPDIVVFNDNWKDSQEQIIRDTGIPPTDDREPAIIVALDPGNYSAIVSGKNGATGIGVVEAYDLGTASLDTSSLAKLGNIATRGFVDTGDNVMIGGFIIRARATRVVVRAIGPSLSAFGVPNALQDTVLELRDGSGSLIASDDDWRSTQEQEIIATGLAPTNDRESAIVATLNPGAYTGIVRGTNGTTGVALVEVYGLQ